MNLKKLPKRQSHLEYYQQHGIAPVRYDLSNLDAHFDRRRSLYNKLGLTALALSGADILEIAAGTGHNSLYLAAQQPQTLTLLEPNPTAIKHIHETYAAYGRQFVVPKIITEKLEDFQPSAEFDIVLCENWLGTSAHESGLLEKLIGFVRPGGVLVLTTVSPIGFVPNLLRRFFANHVVDLGLPFDERTVRLEQAFASHLRTLGAMTRNLTDWVHDNMMNPAYFGLCLSAPRALDLLGSRFEVLGTYPCFVEDWRWFKQLHGDAREINQHFLGEYWQKCHNFLDTRRAPFLADAATNQGLEIAADKLLRAIEANEDAMFHSGNVQETADTVVQRLTDFIELVPEECTEARVGLGEAQALAVRPSVLTVADVASMHDFTGLFGRETSYLSLERSVNP